MDLEAAVQPSAQQHLQVSGVAATRPVHPSSAAMNCWNLVPKMLRMTFSTLSAQSTLTCLCRPSLPSSRRFPALQRLDLSACRRAQDWELRSLMGLRELGALRLDGLDSLTDAGVALLLPLGGQLTALSLRNCSKVRRPPALLGGRVIRPCSAILDLVCPLQDTHRFCAAET